MKGCGTYSIGLGVVAVSLCAAGVALGDIDSRLAWQAWHLVTSTFVLRGRLQHWAGSGGVLGSALVARAPCRVGFVQTRVGKS